MRRAVDCRLKTDPKLSQNRPSRARSGWRLNARQDRGSGLPGQVKRECSKLVFDLLKGKTEMLLDHRNAAAF